MDYKHLSKEANKYFASQLEFNKWLRVLTEDEGYCIIEMLKQFVEEWQAASQPQQLREDENMVSIEELYDYGEWARANGEQHRGNLQKNRKQLYEYYLKNKAAWKRMQ